MNSTLSDSSIYDKKGMNLPDALVAQFLWVCLLIWTAVANLEKLPVGEISGFISIGLVNIMAAGILLVISRSRGVFGQLVVMCSALLLVFLPGAIFASIGQEKLIFMDVYFVVLIATPVLLRIWNWKWQLMVSVLSLLALATNALREGTWSDPQSIILIIAAALLSVLVLYFRDKRGSEVSLDAYDKAEKILIENSQGRMSRYCWHVLFLLGALLLLLLFLDFSVFGAGLSAPVVCKGYSIIILVLAGMLFNLAPVARLGSYLAYTVVVLSIVFSITRLGYGNEANLYYTLPQLFLIGLVVSLPWSLTTHAAIVWAMVLGDLLVRYLAWSSLYGFNYDTAGVILAQYHSEITLLSIGAMCSIVVARVQRYSRFTDLLGVASEKDGSFSQSHINTLKEPLAANLGAERLQRLMVWQFLLGIASSTASSRLLLLLNNDLWWAAMGTWLVFLCLWGLLPFLATRRVPPHYVWGVGIITQLALILWPNILVLVVSDIDLLWLYWPAAVIIGIGCIPWAVSEMIPLLFASVIVGGELVQSLGLGLYVGLGFIFTAVLSAFISVQNGRRLKEKSLLLGFQEAIDRGETEREVLRFTADSLCTLFDSKASVLVGPTKNILELVIPPNVFSLAPEALPLNEIHHRLQRFQTGLEGIEVFFANWLPPDLKLGTASTGVLPVQNCLLIRLDNKKKKRTAVRLYLVDMRL